MYKLLIRKSKVATRMSVNDILDAVGYFFVINHNWKIGSEKKITGHEFNDILKNSKLLEGVFSSLEGNQILFRITTGDGYTIHTTRRHWVEFFEEKFIVEKKEELDSDAPEFSEFMQD